MRIAPLIGSLMARAWHCDGPGCDTWTNGLGIDDWPILTATQHFCTWDCILRFAALKTPTVVIDND